MGELNINQRKIIADYRKTHNVASIITDEAVVNMIREEMIQTGKIYPEFASLIESRQRGEGAKSSPSVWLEGYNNSSSVNHLEAAKTYVKPKEKKNYTPMEKQVARKYIAAMLKAQIKEAIFGEQGFNVLANPNKISGSEGWQELEVLGAKIVKGLGLERHLGQLGVKAPLNRETLEKDLNLAYKRIEELESLVDNPKAFDKKYKEITRGKSIDYSITIDYLRAVNEHQTSWIQDKLGTLEKLKRPTEKFNKMLNIPAVNDFNKWAGRQGTAGQLTGLGIDIALAYMSGGMSTISKATQMTGKAIAETITKKAVQSGIKKETAQIAGMAAELQADYVVGSGLNAGLFQSMHIVSDVSDGDFTRAELSGINDGYWSFFRMGYVGSSISGPMGVKFAEWIGKVINNEKTISIVLNSALKQPTTLGKVLTAVSNNTDFIQKATKFGTSFLMNTEYMALDEGIGFGEALENLAQMEGVSNVVMAFLGGKTTKFLTPEKVQKITTEIENCKVEVAVYKGKKAIKVQTPEGKEYYFASHEELIGFVADRIYTEAGVTHENVPMQNNTETKINKNSGKTSGNKSPAAQTQTVKILPSESGEGFVIRIGENEYIAKDFDEVRNIIDTNASNVANIDFSGLELKDDLCAGTENSELGLVARLKEFLGLNKNKKQKYTDDSSPIRIYTSERPKPSLSPEPVTVPEKPMMSKEQYELVRWYRDYDFSHGKVEEKLTELLSNHGEKEKYTTILSIVRNNENLKLGQKCIIFEILSKSNLNKETLDSLIVLLQHNEMSNRLNVRLDTIIDNIVTNSQTQIYLNNAIQFGLHKGNHYTEFYNGLVLSRDFNKVIPIFDLIKSNEKLINNNNFREHLPEFFFDLQYTNFDKLQSFLQKLGNREDLLQNKDIIKNLGSLVRNLESPSSLDLLPPEIISHPEFSNLLKCQNFVRQIDNLAPLLKNQSPEAKQLINFIISDSKLYNSMLIYHLTNLCKTQVEINRLAQDIPWMKQVVELTNNVNLGGNVGTWFINRNIYEPILKLFSSDPKYYNNPFVKAQLCIIESTKELKNVELYSAAKVTKNSSNIFSSMIIKLKENSVIKNNIELSNKLNDISIKLSTVTDEKILNYINNELLKLSQSKLEKEAINDKLEMLEHLTDVCNEYERYYSPYIRHEFMEDSTNGEYVRNYKYDQGVENHLKSGSGKSFGKRSQHTYLSEAYKNIYKYYYDKAIKEGKSEKDAKTQATKEATWHTEDKVRKNKDFAQESKISSLRDFLQYYPDSEISEHLYNNYYLKHLKDSGAEDFVIEKCKLFNDKYKTKVLLPDVELDKLHEICSQSEAVFESFRKASKGKAKLPRVLDYRSIGLNLFVGGYSSYNLITMNTFNVLHASDWVTTLRHELTHYNDKLATGMKISDDINLNEIMPRKVNDAGEVEVDFENCKFTDEFRKAGINEFHIPYAYENVLEFKAVAAEGDMTKYSPEFKTLLIKLGMPEWMFYIDN